MFVGIGFIATPILILLYTNINKKRAEAHSRDEELNVAIHLDALDPFPLGELAERTIVDSTPSGLKHEDAENSQGNCGALLLGV